MRYRSATEQTLIDCPLAIWDGEAAGCRWCGATVTGRRSVWCSDRCTELFLGNHQWGVARRLALRVADYTCARCGRIGWRDIPPSQGLNIASPTAALADWLPVWSVSWSRSYRVIRRQSEELADLMEREHLRARRDGARMYVGGRATHDLEVNHRVPLAGDRPGGLSCVHHQTGLEVLCRPCHVKETTRQRRAGELGPRVKARVRMEQEALL